MEMDGAPIFVTSCMPYTFLYFVDQHTRIHKHCQPYFDYRKRRRSLRLVCRAWNEFVLFTRHCWLQLGEGSAMYELDSTTTTTTPGARGVGPIERLTMTISLKESVTPVLSWVSHILNRPANQSPLRAYTLRLFTQPIRGYNPLTISSSSHRRPRAPRRTQRYICSQSPHHSYQTRASSYHKSLTPSWGYACSS